MNRYLDTALAITEQAQAIPLKHFRKGLDILHKPDASPVTRADQDTETFIREALHAAFPDHGIIGEEFSDKQTTGRLTWIIDPIDGTRAYVSGLPLFGMLLALLEDGAPRLSVVRMPALAEAWSGDGRQAWLNGRPVSVATTTDLSGAMLYINEADKILAAEPATFARLSRTARDRRHSYDCYPHMLLAGGHVDVVVDYDLKPFDYLALVPVVEGAGGRITDWSGAPLGLHSDGRVLSAATPALHAAMLDILNG